MARAVAEARSSAAPVERLAADQALGGPAAEADGEGVGQVAFPVEPAVVGRERLGQPEGLPGAQHGDPADRVRVRGQRGDQGVASLVDDVK